jgi:hypothetical protein
MTRIRYRLKTLVFEACLKKIFSKRIVKLQNSVRFQMNTRDSTESKIITTCLE